MSNKSKRYYVICVAARLETRRHARRWTGFHGWTMNRIPWLQEEQTARSKLALAMARLVQAMNDLVFCVLRIRDALRHGLLESLANSRCWRFILRNQSVQRFCSETDEDLQTKHGRAETESASSWACMTSRLRIKHSVLNQAPESTMPLPSW